MDQKLLQLIKCFHIPCLIKITKVRVGKNIPVEVINTLLIYVINKEGKLKGAAGLEEMLKQPNQQNI